MSQIAKTDTTVSSTRTGAFSLPGHRSQAYLILYAGFVALPILAGLDKFFHVLVDWEIYLTPLVTDLLPISGATFMMIVGVIEIAAGVLVALYPRVGACVVALWLWGIIANLLSIGSYYDIALRDFGLSLGALALARLSGASLFGRTPRK